jgi:hypothetical protein
MHFRAFFITLTARVEESRGNSKSRVKKRFSYYGAVHVVPIQSLDYPIACSSGQFHRLRNAFPRKYGASNERPCRASVKEVTSGPITGLAESKQANENPLHPTMPQDSIHYVRVPQNRTAATRNAPAGDQRVRDSCRMGEAHGNRATRYHRCEVPKAIGSEAVIVPFVAVTGPTQLLQLV